MGIGRDQRERRVPLPAATLPGRAELRVSVNTGARRATYPRGLACARRALLLGVVGLSACASAPLRPQPLGWQTVHWRRCPDGVPGAERADCAHVEVPLDWDDPSGPTITVFARRFLPGGAPLGQLWALDGGPGEPGDGLSQGVFVDTVLNAGFELVVPTHRGNAYGTTLQCPGATDEGSCIAAVQAEWGAGLRHFEARQAARDVVALAAAHPPPTRGTARIFGGSYGTVWLQRTVQAAPALFDGVYMDAAGDLGMDFERIGAWFDAAGRALLLRCDEDPSCAARFPDGAVAAAAQVHSDAVAGAGCPSALGVGLPELQALFSRLLQGTTERLWVAPLLYRLQRCSPDDQRVIRLALAEPAPPPPTSSHFNALLNWTAIYRGLYHVSLPAAELEALANASLFDNGGMLTLARRRGFFPDDFDDRSPVGDLAAYTGSVHIVQGALDPLTPEQLLPAITTRFPNAELDTVVLPDGGHASPRFTLRPDGERCTMRWLANFLADPSVPFDVGCLSEVPVLDLGVTQLTSRELSEAFWGVRDAWDG